ncbi:hypothetical protein FRC02_000053 [Tulasnella sp. 418]|nr:hypothetical protein FRC02_000053 [Tulasnella sp. 418]
MADALGGHMLSSSIGNQSAPNVTLQLPKLGQTRCYWLLLSSQLQIMYLDPVLEAHMGPQGPLLSTRCILDFIHPQELPSARNDLSEVLRSKGLDGSVTRVRFLRLSTIRTRLGAPEHALDHFPGQELIAYDDDYLAADLVINWVAEGVVLCFIHAIVDLSDRDNDVLNKTDWTNWCGTVVMQTQHAQRMYEALSTYSETPLHDHFLYPSPSPSSRSSPLAREIPSDAVPNRIFQLVTNDSRRSLILSWPDHPAINKDDFARLVQDANLDLGYIGTGAKTSCTRRFKSPKKMRDSITGKSKNVESIFIPHGCIIFACHRIVPSHSEQQYYGNDGLSSQTIAERMSLDRATHSPSEASSNSSSFTSEPSFPQPLHFNSDGVLVPTSPDSYKSYQLRQLQVHHENQLHSTSTSPPAPQLSRQPSLHPSFPTSHQHLPSVQSPSASPRFSNYSDSSADYHPPQKVRPYLSDTSRDSYQGHAATYDGQESVNYQSTHGSLPAPGYSQPTTSPAQATTLHHQSSQTNMTSYTLTSLAPSRPHHLPAPHPHRQSPLDSGSPSSSWDGYAGGETTGDSSRDFVNHQVSRDPYVMEGEYARSGTTVPPVSSLRGSVVGAESTDDMPRVAPLPRVSSQSNMLDPRPSPGHQHGHASLPHARLPAPELHSQKSFVQTPKAEGHDYGYQFSASSQQAIPYDSYHPNPQGSPSAQSDASKRYDPLQPYAPGQQAGGRGMPAFSSHYQYMAYSRSIRGQNQVDLSPSVEQQPSFSSFTTTVSLNSTIPDQVQRSGPGGNTTSPGVQRCITCGTVNSPEWRKGPSGKKELCNACGLRFSRSKQKKDGILPQRRKKEKDVISSSMRRESSPAGGSALRGKRVARKATGPGTVPTLAEPTVKQEYREDMEADDITNDSHSAITGGPMGPIIASEGVKQEGDVTNANGYGSHAINPLSSQGTVAIPKWSNGSSLGADPSYQAADHGDSYTYRPPVYSQDAFQRPPHSHHLPSEAHYSNHVADPPSHGTFYPPAPYSAQGYDRFQAPRAPDPSYNRSNDYLLSRDQSLS